MLAKLSSCGKLELARSGEVYGSTDMAIPMPIPIPILPSRIDIKPILISVLKFISNQYQ